MFAERLSDLMKSKDWVQADVADLTGKSVAAVSNWLNGAMPHRKTREEIAEALGVPYNYLFPNPDNNIAMDDPADYQYRRITYLPTGVHAGEGAPDVDQRPIKELRIQLPQLPVKEGVAFPIVGDSMAPVLTSGDIIICTEVHDWNDLRQHQVYVIENTDEERVVKYVTRYGDHLVLHSNDPVRYPDQEIYYQDIERIWVFRLRITPDLARPGAGLDRRVDSIEAYLRKRFPGWWREI